MESRGRKRKKAVALRYKANEDRAPKITAKGQGPLAEKILDLARQHGVPVRQDADLMEMLSGLELNAEIPPETYVVVAEILAWIYRLNRVAGEESASQ
jgi:flagellar biosynthesis protein